MASSLSLDESVVVCDDDGKRDSKINFYVVAFYATQKILSEFYGALFCKINFLMPFLGERRKFN